MYLSEEFDYYRILYRLKRSHVVREHYYAYYNENLTLRNIKVSITCTLNTMLNDYKQSQLDAYTVDDVVILNVSREKPNNVR